MSILKIAKIGHPILIKKAKEINDLGSEKIKKLVYDMTETMLDADGVGLAAPQVHIDKRIFIYRNPEVENDIILASHLLNCHTIIIMPHTKCAMASLPLADIQQKLSKLTSKDFSNFKPRMIDDANAKLRADVELLQNHPMIKDGVKVLGAIYDVDTGLVNWFS